MSNQVYFRFEPGVVFELLGPAGAEAPVVTTREDVPVTPMFRVDDIDAVATRLRQHGVRIITEPAAPGESRARILTFLDPENHHICVFQM